MFRKNSIQKLGPIDPELKQICDLEFFLRIAYVFGLKYIPQQLCSFRIHDSSTTERNVNSNDYYMENIEAIIYALKLLTKPEFKNFRSYIGSSGVGKMKMFVKFRSYKASKAVKTIEDQKIFNDLASKYGQFMYKEVIFVYLIRFLNHLK
jgi:hypothetical protein